MQELYEPLWEDLQQLLAERGRRIRSIWIADTSNQGASGLLNGDSKYDDSMIHLLQEHCMMAYSN